MKKNIIALLLGLFGLSQGVSAQTTTPANTSGTFANDSVEAFAAYLADDSVQLVDVRSADEYAKGHLPHAVNIDVLDSTFITRAETTLLKDRKVALYCRSGKRSAKAAAQLSAAGYKVANLVGGILAWEAAGKEVTKE